MARTRESEFQLHARFIVVNQSRLRFLLIFGAMRCPLRLFVNQLRTVCYNLLGLACRQGALYLAIPADKVQDVIIDRLLSGLEYVENRFVWCVCACLCVFCVLCFYHGVAFHRSTWLHVARDVLCCARNRIVPGIKVCCGRQEDRRLDRPC